MEKKTFCANRGCLFVVFIAFLLLSNTVAFAKVNDYVSTEYVGKAGILIQFPETVYSITQDSLPTDSFFQLYGTELFDIAMTDLKDNSVYLDSINDSFTWELRVTVKEEALIDLRNISKSRAESFAQSTGDEMKSLGMDVTESYAIMHTYSAFLVIHSTIQGRHIFTCMTSNGRKTIAITISDTYIGSIADEELKNLVSIIIDGIAFEEDPSVSIDRITQTSKQDINIDDIGVSLKLPSGIKWATLYNGDRDYVASNYHLNTSNLNAYMESNSYYLMAVDPDSSFRFSLSKTIASSDVKNFTLLPDEALFSDHNDEELSEILSLNTFMDEWIWRDEKNAISCMLSEIGDTKQYLLSATTAIDGYFYIFVMRDKDEKHLRSIAKDIFSSFTVLKLDKYELMDISILGKQIYLPANWTIPYQGVEYIDGLGMSDNAIIEAHTSDGTRRTAMITIFDFASFYWENATKIQRESFDRIYSDALINSMLQGQGLTAISTMNCYDVEFTVYRIEADLADAAMVGFAHGYMVKIEWYVPTIDALTDEWVPSLQKFVGDLVHVIKE